MNNGWDKWGAHIQTELGRLADESVKHTEQFGKIREDIAGLKVKATVWGLLGGAVPVVIGLAIYLIRELIKGGNQ